MIPDWLGAALRCPRCRDELDRGAGSYACRGCHTSYRQRDPRIVDLMAPLEQVPGWLERQGMMAREYDALAADRDHAILAYHNDFDPLREHLARARGRVLDVGGGVGIARHWLPDPHLYVTLEPSLSWLEQPWQQLSDEFPCLGEPPPFVRSMAERMPFAGSSFDAALSIWSLNHVAEPARVLAESARVLRPGGRFLVVLDDVGPSWTDLFDGAFYTSGLVDWWRAARRKLWSTAFGWPIHADHLAIRESALRRWLSADWQLLDRTWIKHYLVYELERRTPAH